MKLNANQIEHLVDKVLVQWKKNNVVIFKENEARARARMIQSIKEEFEKEATLEKEVHRMLDELERSHGGEFQRHKMYPLLKQKLAKERKVVL